MDIYFFGYANELKNMDSYPYKCQKNNMTYFFAADKSNLRRVRISVSTPSLTIGPHCPGHFSLILYTLSKYIKNQERCRQLKVNP